jgi:membrane protease subunit HflK
METNFSQQQATQGGAMEYRQGGRPSNPLDRKIIEIVDRLKSGKPSSKLILILPFLFLLIGAFSSFYKVDTEETGVLLRFGRFSSLAEPGLHMKFPFGIDRVYKAKTGRVLKEEFGFRTLQAGVRTTYTKRNLEDESLTLTGDLNVSDVEWIVQYQITGPFKYLFRIDNPEETIRDVSEAMVRKVVGNSNVSEVLTTERAMLADNIQKDLQKILNSYDIGVRIVTVKFQDVNPPDPVKAAFNEVNEAEQQKESLIFQAREQYNREVPKARGVARSAIQQAEGYAIERTNKARGETNRFLALYTEYRKAPEVTRQRLYLETLEKILPKLDEVYVMDQAGAGALPLLQLRTEKKGDRQ